jgi:iron-regulated transporter 1
VPELQQPKSRPEQESCNPSTRQDGRIARIWSHVTHFKSKSAQDFGLYFGHPIFLPSFAGALLYLTVLSFAGQMVTYLMSVGYDSTQIGIARTLSVGFEVLATWVAPWLMGRIGPIRAGLWLASWQMICLVAGISVFWAFAGRPIVSASGLIGGTILSRVGLRGFDLCAQILVQEVSFPNISAAQLDCDFICSYLDA